jgi:hypothetical protein
MTTTARCASAITVVHSTTAVVTATTILAATAVTIIRSTAAYERALAVSCATAAIRVIDPRLADIPTLLVGHARVIVRVVIRRLADNISLAIGRATSILVVDRWWAHNITGATDGLARLNLNFKLIYVTVAVLMTRLSNASVGRQEENDETN